MSPKSKIAPGGIATHFCLLGGIPADPAESGGETARHDTSRAVLNFIALMIVLPVPPEDNPRQRVTTVMLPVQVGSIWRVQIVWPNGAVHYFGTFASRQSAAEWVASHSWLTVRVKTPDDAAG